MEVTHLLQLNLLLSYLLNITAEFLFIYDFPEMLSYIYLVVKGYWRVNDNGETVEVKKPPFSSIALLNAMKEITKRVRNGTTIEEIVNEKELCGDVEEI